MIKRLVKRIRRWNSWRKVNTNGKLHHIKVLLGIIYSPTFEFFYDLKWSYENLKPIGVVTGMSDNETGITIQALLNNEIWRNGLKEKYDD